MCLTFVYILVSVILVVCFLYYENNVITVTRHSLKFSKLPEAFDGYTIMQISDVHNKSFGRAQKKITDIVRKMQPDMIAITGDLIDRRRFCEEPALELVRQVSQYAPVYFATGNHEMGYKEYPVFEKKLRKLNIRLLRNERDILTRGNKAINIIGVDSPKIKNRINPTIREGLNKTVRNLGREEFKLLLAHRPERFPIYKSFGVDLVLSGHAHGGQIRLPGIGGLFAPEQGVFPKYTSGVYKESGCVMVVSRGLGPSSFPFRIFNRPEIVMITLKTK